jgi:hypothetical protein
MSIFEDCSLCLQHELKACAETYTLDLGLDPETTYLVSIDTIDDNTFEQEIETDESGVLTIDTEDYPAGLFNQYSGTMLIHIYENTEACEPLDVCTDKPCIAVSFKENILRTNITCCD